MFTRVLKRIAIALVTILVTGTLAFILVRVAPGSPIAAKQLPSQAALNLTAYYGLDQPLWVQYLDYLRRVFVDFDFGPSFQYHGRSVRDVLATALPVTLTIGLWAALVATVCGAAIGTAAAIWRGQWIDHLAVGLTILMQMVPTFVVAPVLVLVFTLTLRWLPGGGWNAGDPAHVILPVFTLALTQLPNVTRIVRASAIEVLGSNYMLVARGKGLPWPLLYFRHALRPTLLPLVSYLGPMPLSLVAGMTLTDLFFSTGGVGTVFVSAALARDYAVVVTITLASAVLITLSNCLIDLLYAALDPRIGVER
jgi:oligopeptide transport system permease protein